MCEICLSSPCAAGCPNADEPKSIGICTYCKEQIEVGEEYYEYNEDIYHEDCFFDVAVRILLEEGAMKKIAEIDEDEFNEYYC